MRRIAELDGLRGLAAVLIVIYHFDERKLPGCWAAVDVFFVLSGYLITAIILQNNMSWQFLKSFYLRRGLRIWPTYYLFAFLLVLAGLGSLEALPYFLTYTQRTPLFGPEGIPVWGLMEHTWTLALEEQFYLIWPALVLLAGRHRTGYLALAFAAISVEARYAGFSPWGLLGRCDGFALGGFLAAIMADADVERARRRALTWAFVFAVVAMLQVALLTAVGNSIVGKEVTTTAVRQSIASIASYILVALVVCLAGRRVLSPLRMAPLVYLGTISYGIYLYHYPFVKSPEMIGHLLGVESGPALNVMMFVLSIVVAVVSWHFLERPILRLKERIPYRRTDIPSEDEGASSGATPLQNAPMSLGRVTS